MPASPRVVVVDLEAREADWTIGPDLTVRGWCFNGMVLAPTLEAGARDTLVVNLKNSLPEPTTVHWHGLRIPVSMDGNRDDSARTNPLRWSDHIQEALLIFREMAPPVVISATPSHRSPHFNMVSIDARGEVELVIPRGRKGKLQRRQDCPTTWDLNCNIYAYERGFLMDNRNESPLVQGARLCEMPTWTFRDIDTLDHFEIAECLARWYLLGMGEK